MNKGKDMISDDGTKIYTPKEVTSVFETNVITDNYTDEKGNVYNRSDINAVDARRWVDANQK